MFMPHLDKRVVDGDEYLMFGPYATFSTKLPKGGKLTDFFTTLRWHNLHVLAAAAAQSLSLVHYLIGELFTPFGGKIKQLQRFYPDADPRDRELVPAGQRAQLVTPDPERIGALRSGTELVTSADGTIAGLLGASPGASTAVPIMPSPAAVLRALGHVLAGTHGRRPGGARHRRAAQPLKADGPGPHGSPPRRPGHSAGKT